MAPPTRDHAADVPSLSGRTSKHQPTMGLLDAINLLIACIIGSGIFISAKAVLEYSGSYGLSIIVWVGCGLLCIMVKIEESIHRCSLMFYSGRCVLCRTRLFICIIRRRLYLFTCGIWRFYWFSSCLDWSCIISTDDCGFKCINCFELSSLLVLSYLSTTGYFSQMSFLISSLNCWFYQFIISRMDESSSSSV